MLLFRLSAEKVDASREAADEDVKDEAPEEEEEEEAVDVASATALELVVVRLW